MDSPIKIEMNNFKIFKKKKKYKIAWQRNNYSILSSAFMSQFLKICYKKLFIYKGI